MFTKKNPYATYRQVNFLMGIYLKMIKILVPHNKQKYYYTSMWDRIRSIEFFDEWDDSDILSWHNRMSFYSKIKHDNIKQLYILVTNKKA